MSDYWKSSLQQVKLNLRKKKISWKNALSVFNLDEMIQWFRVGNSPERVTNAVVLRYKESLKLSRVINKLVDN